MVKGADYEVEWDERPELVKKLLHNIGQHAEQKKKKRISLGAPNEIDCVFLGFIITECTRLYCMMCLKVSQHIGTTLYSFC